jgi:transcriptional regulator with XRE-family HTH domain
MEVPGDMEVTQGETDRRFGSQLRLCREDAGLKLTDLAELTHFSVSYLSRVETGGRQALRHLAERCDSALGAGGALLALVPVTPAEAGEPSLAADRAVKDAAPVGGTSRDGSTRREAKLLGAAPWPSAGPALPWPPAGPAQGRPSGHGADFDTAIGQGDEAQAAGKMIEAERWYMRAHASAAGDPRAQAEAVIRVARRWSDPGRVDRDVIQRINAALDGLAGDSSAEAALLRLRLHAHLAKKLSLGVSEDTALPGTGPAQGAALARRTLEQVPADCPDEDRCEVLTECRWALFDHTPVADLLSLSRELQDTAVRAGSAYFQGEALVALAVDQVRVGQISSALATIEQHRSYAGRSRSALARWYQCTFDTLLDLWRGNFTAAADWIFGESQAIVAALEASLEIPADNLAQTRMGQAYWLLREQGRMAELFTSDLIAGVERHGFSPIWRAGLVLALCETDHWTDAADQLQAFCEDTDQFRALPASGWAVPTLTLLAEACAAIDAHGGGRDAGLTELVPLLDTALASHHPEIALAGWPTAMLGPVARTRGLLALATGDGPRALTDFQFAARFARTSRPQMARLRADRARALLRHPDLGAPGEAASLLAAAQSAASELGMARLATQISELQDSPATTRP